MTRLDRERRLREVVVSPDATIADALERMDRAGTGGLALCTDDGMLAGFLTDGDIRRAVLRGVSLSDPCETVANHSPVVASAPVSDGEALHLMGRNDVNHLPVIDGSGVLVDLLLRIELATRDAIEGAAARRLESVIIEPDVPIATAIERLDRAGTGALLLCSDGGRLVGLLTDGDLRRAILRHVPLTNPCRTIAFDHPITAPDTITTADALDLMVEHDINHLPLLDASGAVSDFLLRRDIAVDGSPGLSAVIMAGGFGKRLMPLTEGVPKPMLPLGDRPVLERTIRQLRRSGIRDVSMTTHYLADRIEEHFGDGEEFGVRINYTSEDQPMGTAGGLKLLERPAGPFVVINGDILTGVSFDKMLEYHHEHQAELTVGVRHYVIDVPFGVVECEESRVTELREKPSLAFFINAGIYLLEPSAWESIPDGVYSDMTDLIKVLLDEGRTVASFPIIEYWLDIGRPEDYQRAQDELTPGPG
jgi:dTDP-glucose pyrophosphorylase/predicted transcriptional regulator